jgi:hypothetical protein
MSKEFTKKILSIFNHSDYSWLDINSEDVENITDEIEQHWKCPIKNEPPINKEILVKNQNGKYHLTFWYRLKLSFDVNYPYKPIYGIFGCQSKGVDLYGWKYIILEY